MSAGYDGMITKIPLIKPHGNVGGSIGFGYEYRNSGLWLNGGLQMSLHHSSMDVGEETFHYAGYDTQGRRTTFHYRVTQRDQIEWKSFDIPLMAGYYIYGAHAGLGVKLSYAIRPQTHTVGTYNLSATNEAYDIPFADQPEYGYTDYASEGTDPNRLNIGVSVIGEIGYDVLSQMMQSKEMCHILKISFYFEFGLNNILRSGTATNRLELLDADNATRAQIHAYANSLKNPGWTAPFFTGLKISYLIGGSLGERSKGIQKGCGCYER